MDRPRRLAFLLRMLAFVLPTVVLGATAMATPDRLSASLGVAAPSSLSVVTRAVVVTLAVLPAFFTSVALLRLARCALAVAAGEGLTVAAARDLRSAGTWMLVTSVGSAVAPTLAALALSAETGSLALTIHLGAGVLLPLVLSAALRLVGGLVVDAAAVARENAQFV